MKSLALESLSKFGDVTIEPGDKGIVRIRQGYDVIVLHREAVPDFIRCLGRIVEEEV